jgi:hypothetical protein
LKIKGYVRVQDDPFSEFRYSIGIVRLKNIHAAMGTVIKGETKKKIIEIVNTSASEPAKVSFKDLPRYMDVNINPVQLKPGEKGIMEIAFHSDRVDDWDYVIDRLELLINDKSLPDNTFTVTSVVREDFSKLTAEELNMAPRISVEMEKINFGNVSRDQKVENEFVIKNIGETDLIIRKVRASCGCTAAEPAVNIISPGRSTSIKTVFNPAGKSGKQKYAITIITNDPKNYKKILWLEGTVASE